MLRIDLEQGWVAEDTDGAEVRHALDTPQAFALVSKAWLRAGWDTKYVYGFSWMGRPIIQLPEDMIRIQEVIYRVKPDLIIETGVAHGGSLIYYASLCKAMERGRVVGIDIEIRPHNRKAIEAHELAGYITLFEGSSIAPAVVKSVKDSVRPGDNVLVILDSNHTRDHVRGELEAYSPLVTRGSYIVATDGIMKDLVGAPRGRDDWGTNNPYQAACDFAAAHPEFVVEQPAGPFNEGVITEHVTYWPGAWLKRR